MSLTSWFIGSMFMSMAGLLLLGFPVGFTLIVHGVAFTVLGAWLGAVESAAAARLIL